MLRKTILAMFIALLAGFMLTACGTGEESNQENNDTNENTKADAGSGDDNSSKSADSSESEVRVIQHAMGETEVTGTPKRIVTLYQGATDAAIAMGVTPVGIVESWVEKPVYKYLRDDLDGVPIVGLETQPNLEEIAKLNPDLIIASKLRHEEIYDKLEQIAPTVTHETVYEFKETVELMGEAMNMEEKADEVLAAWDNRVADFKAKVQEKLGDKWPLNVALLNFRADHARIYFTSFAGIVLNDLGFERPENQQEDVWGIKLTSKESIPEMNADIFYIFMSDDEAVHQTYEEWTNHPLWKNLDAVQNDQVYLVDEVAWNMGGGILAANLMLDDIYDRLGLEK
ncbi:iron complex transport system substrate-binding protein [Melghiribacillus thermohalophilus]|uniref:Iron complex transport system substrate-binding protein n=1 Tax=Melghiribacillus thermohalophilus TaxID=1324956 RepID=A0A4R3N0R5_9BACI|nr:iron-siderophore ABC transporter substrate-binding protein [Melghiribacillus thermohalophilus]TCT22375.1 iron complex transport system substrate-binding protein [Melghiribacillus thermohalophilus]